MNMLSAKYAKMPEFLGQSIETVNEGGKLFTKIGDSMQEVVYATASDLAKLPYPELSEGFYLVGSGNTGVAGAMATIAAIYGATVMTSGFLIKKPTPGYIPQVISCTQFQKVFNNFKNKCILFKILGLDPSSYVYWRIRKQCQRQYSHENPSILAVVFYLNNVVYWWHGIDVCCQTHDQ